MNYSSFETRIAAEYNRVAPQYRRDDEIEALAENHQRLGGNLRRTCRSFAHPVRVLELGCGTGRYFHWLDNACLLVATDISAEMLKQAQQPLCADRVSIGEIRLLQRNLFETTFEPESFDFIYCLGVFGYGAAVTDVLCQRFARWLVPGGRLYFDAIQKNHTTRFERMKQPLKLAVKRLLPGTLHRMKKASGDEPYVPVVKHTRAQLERVMQAAGFEDFILSINTCDSPLWTGTHLECSARKNG